MSDLKILLAEDNPVNQKVIELFLKNKGYCIEIAENGREVLEILNEKKIDVIIMDVQMPEVDGFEATRLIRNMEKITSRKPVYILAMTGNSTSEDREKCFQAGMDDFISKPFNPTELLSKLKFKEMNP